MMEDPRESITHDITAGQVYKDDRSGDHLILVYADKKVILLRDRDGNHRLDPRRPFETNVGSGRYKLAPDAESFGDTGRIGRVLRRADEYEAEGGRKAIHYADALREAVGILTDDGPSDSNVTVEFEEIDGVGPSTATNLREAGYTTRGDVRRASDEELRSVGGIGAGNLKNIREAIK